MQHAEALLLVNHHEAEVFESDVVLHDAMRADDDVHGPGGKVFDDVSSARAASGNRLRAFDMRIG